MLWIHRWDLAMMGPNLPKIAFRKLSGTFFGFWIAFLVEKLHRFLMSPLACHTLYLNSVGRSYFSEIQLECDRGTDSHSYIDARTHLKRRNQDVVMWLKFKMWQWLCDKKARLILGNLKGWTGGRTEGRTDKHTSSRNARTHPKWSMRNDKN